MSKRCAVFSCRGIGDALLALQLCYNLHLNGHQAHLFHDSFDSLCDWFPDIKIHQKPLLDELKTFAKDFDQVFLFLELEEGRLSFYAQTLLEAFKASGKIEKKDIFFLNPIATKKKDPLFWDHGRFDGRVSLSENIFNFCEKQLNLPDVIKTNGIFPLTGLKRNRYPNRVVLHPTSSNQAKNWPKESYLRLQEVLKKLGYEPSFILTKTEKQNELWGCDCPEFINLNDLAAYIFESGYMIGNDSGVGHLASSLKIPTLTLCASTRAALFWKPDFFKGIVLQPPKWIPNFKWFRMRDRYWKKLITVNRVIKAFKKLTSL